MLDYGKTFKMIHFLKKTVYKAFSQPNKTVLAGHSTSKLSVPDRKTECLGHAGTLLIQACISHQPVFSNVCQTAQNFLMYVTSHSFLRCMSHHPVFSNVCHTAQNSPMYVTPPSFLRCMSHSPEFSDVCHTT